MTARNTHEVAVAVKRERVDCGLEFLDDYFIRVGKRSRFANDARSSITVT